MAKLPHRKCANKECRQWFHPIREGQIVCSYQCASAVGKEQTRKAREAAQRKAQSLQRAAEKKERATWRQRKAAVKPLKHWIDLTQRAVNDICRETELAEGNQARGSGGSACAKKAGGRMKPELIEILRMRWQRLRIYRRPGSVLVDYRILRNFVRIYQFTGFTQ